eukprot:CAMPEP_0181228910 /NCGR_PEP_ID=MMETSP1096-20121128/33604_1 /TAXON_ID=156174 ORGANISM="Chrysochromulina ericina, Strain CCMP281" /NCGR_SAMPLE_ID=MMETSP1096 /ASSEMBLY_ACC=CAM_ASM_000453 /LENGTH=48 /DNA_ID= /DNA_START= /DNA_END= /DNA_ORIENTATION=
MAAAAPPLRKDFGAESAVSALAGALPFLPPLDALPWALGGAAAAAAAA